MRGASRDATLNLRVRWGRARRWRSALAHGEARALTSSNTAPSVGCSRPDPGDE